MSNPLDGCFFFPGSADDSFFAPLNDATEAVLCMSEAYVSDYIRACRPDLFKRLHGLPIKSFEVHIAEPQSSAQHVLHTNKPLSRSQKPRPALISIDGRPSSVSTSPVANHSQFKLLEVQHKRHILSRLLSGYHLLLRRVRNYSVPITCACPLCSQRRTSLEFGTFFLTLVDKSGLQSPKFSTSSACYSLLCVESLFKTESRLYSAPVKDTVVEAWFDGINDMPKRKRDSQIGGNSNDALKTSQASDLPFYYPSNSSVNQRLREEREEEIKEILKAESKLEHAYNEFSGAVVPRLPDLTLRRPPNHTNLDERYKKQGLTRNDQEKYSRQQKLDRARTISLEAEHEANRQVLPSPTDTLFEQEHDRICYCREPENGTGFDVIKCAGEFCLVGWFHLRCIELEEELGDGEGFFCEDCLPYAKQQHQESGVSTRVTSGIVTDVSTLINTSESDGDASAESSDEAQIDEKAAWAEQEHAIVTVALNEIPEALNQPQDALIASTSDEDIDDWEEADEYLEEEEGEDAESLSTPGFTAINSTMDAQLDGCSSQHRKYTKTSPLYISPRRRTGADYSQGATNAAPRLPAGYTSTPFYALAPFIRPSLTENDPHALTTDEARYIWAWRANSTPTALVAALPKSKKEALIKESQRTGSGLREWWRHELKRLGLQGAGVFTLSEVLAHWET